MLRKCFLAVFARKSKQNIAKICAILVTFLLCYLLAEVSISHGIYHATISINPRIFDKTAKLIKPQVCKFMEVDPYTPLVMKLSGSEKTSLKCSGYMPDLTYINGSRLEIDQRKVISVDNFTFCKYVDIFRHPKSDNLVELGEWNRVFNTSIDLPDTTEFILVVCENSSAHTVSKTYHALVPKKVALLELDKLRFKKRQVESEPMETLNVVMIGMDGTSRNQMIRGMNKTYTFLMKELNSFDMSMYSQLGVNTFPNLVPLLSGHSEGEVDLWWNADSHIDPMDTIWKDYANAGYRTLFSEDYTSIGPFHYQKKGFFFPPTTYYSHPICEAMGRDKEIWRAGTSCLGNTPEIYFHFNYLKTFLETVKEVPVFAMLFLKKMTHDDMTDNRRADRHTYNFYRSLKKYGHLNRTLLISFSDHGPRWGPIRHTVNGMVESRSPYAIFTFPEWFMKKYPDVAENLRLNAKRLTTHFDTHATLRDLLYFKASGTIPLAPTTHGISLFQEIPINRTCNDIPIPMEFCLCDQETMTKLPDDSKLAKHLADIVVRSVNAKRDSTICAELQLKDVLQVMTVNFSNLNERDHRLFKVKITTVPGDAVYEGTVRTRYCNDDVLVKHLDTHDAGIAIKRLDISVGESIDRLTLYKGQADCELNSFKKPYCYCRDLLPEYKTNNDTNISTSATFP